MTHERESRDDTVIYRFNAGSHVEPMQPDLFAALPQPAPDYRPDPAKVRAQLHDVLSQAKAAPAKPWRTSDREFYRVVFPQMANWLPSGERQQLCFEFDTELARLEAA